MSSGVKVNQIKDMLGNYALNVSEEYVAILSIHAPINSAEK
jgi:hypothetical protein